MKYRFIAPIRNLDMKVRKLQVGNVIFYSSPLGIIDSDVRKRMKNIVKGSKVAGMQKWYSRINEKTKDKAVAYVPVESGKKLSREQAISEIELALNVLRFYLRGITSLDQSEYRMHIGMEGTTPSDTTLIMLFTEDGGFSTYSERFGYVHRYTLDKAAIRSMKRNRLKELNEILTKPEDKRSVFERSILTSIGFFGSAMNETVYRNALVDFIISLESLLLGDRETKGASLAERVALILGNNSTERLRIFKTIHDIYALRSNIVHEGKDKVNKDDLYEISRTGFQTIVKLIPQASTILDKKELREIVNNLKYSAPKFRVKQKKKRKNVT